MKNTVGKDPESKRPRLAVLASGSGTDFQSIVDAVEAGDLNVALPLLICNVPDAGVLERARRHSVKAVLLPHKGLDRDEYDARLHDTLVGHDIDLVALAGFMRMLSTGFVEKWKYRLVNIHPALLPSFPGVHAHRDAISYGVKVSGLTIHFVDEQMDHGPIILQKAVEVREDDTESTLGARVLEQEHIWYPKVLQWIAEGRVKVEGRRVYISGGRD